MRLLVVEDDPHFAAVVAELLTDEGHAVAHAASHADALARMDEGRWDGFVVDAFAPRSWVRLHPEDRATLRRLAARAPVLVATEEAWARAATAEELGVAALLLKPCDLDAFLEAVSHLRARRAGARRPA